MSEIQITHIDDPQHFFKEHTPELVAVGAAAFQRQPAEFATQVEERFREAELAQITTIGGQIVGFGVCKFMPSELGTVLSIEGRALAPGYQGRGLGKLGLRAFLRQYPEVVAAASCTRNPAVPRLMQSSFTTVFPDVRAPGDPLHQLNDDPRIAAIARDYADFVGADPHTAPFVLARYTGGLYGKDDPGRTMPIPEISQNPENAIVMVALDRSEK